MNQDSSLYKSLSDINLKHMMRNKSLSDINLKHMMRKGIILIIL